MKLKAYNLIIGQYSDWNYYKTIEQTLRSAGFDLVLCFPHQHEPKHNKTLKQVRKPSKSRSSVSAKDIQQA